MNLLRDFTDTIKAGGSGGSSALTLDLERENEEVLQRYRAIVDLVNAREAEIEVLSDDALKARSREARPAPALSRTAEDESIIVEGFALVREAAAGAPTRLHDDSSEGSRSWTAGSRRWRLERAKPSPLSRRRTSPPCVGTAPTS